MARHFVSVTAQDDSAAESHARNHLPRSHPRGDDRRDAARSARLPHRRRRRRVRRRVQDQRRDDRGVRSGARHRHADLRGGHRRRGLRRGADGHAADRGDAVHRLHHLRVRHARQLHRHVALPRRQRLPDRRSRTGRRRHAWRTVPLAQPRGDVHEPAGDQDRRAGNRVRRQGPAQGRHPRRRSGALHRAQVPLSPDQRKSCRRRTTSSRSARPTSDAAGATSRSSRGAR